LVQGEFVISGIPQTPPGFLQRFPPGALPNQEGTGGFTRTNRPEVEIKQQVLNNDMIALQKGHFANLFR